MMSLNDLDIIGIAQNGCGFFHQLKENIDSNRHIRRLHAGETGLGQLFNHGKLLGVETSGADDHGDAAISGLPGKTFQGMELSAKSGINHSGKGEAAANNVFTGTITVTVIEVMPNGNLLVSGEKQVSIGAGTEYIRLSGIVNPYFISAANSISSANVADARIEYKESGIISEAQVMGWLARFFLSTLPF